MKSSYRLLLLCFLTIAIASCKKSEPQTTALASLNVTNAVVGGATLNLNSLNSSDQNVGNSSFTQFSILTGQSRVDLYDPTTNPVTTYYNQVVPTVNGSSYSLFLTGASPASVDAILIKESYQNYTDSVCGVRFINLSPDSKPISVDIQGNANGSEVASLAYKAYTGFKKYVSNTIVSSYNFEIRDAATGNLLTTYNLTTQSYHNITLAVTGLENNGGVSILQDNDFY